MKGLIYFYSGMIFILLLDYFVKGTWELKEILGLSILMIVCLVFNYFILKKKVVKEETGE